MKLIWNLPKLDINCNKISKTKFINNVDSVYNYKSSSMNNIRRLLNLMEDYNYNYKSLSVKNIEKFDKQTLLKDTNIGLYDDT